MYGFERVEGSIEERAAEYVPKLLEMHKGPFVVAGWSLGGALDYACAIGLKQAGAEVRFVGLIDAVRPGVPIPQTKEEMRKRWDRYARFAERTFNVEIPEIPYEELEKLDDEGQVRFVLDVVKESGVQIPGGALHSDDAGDYVWLVRNGAVEPRGAGLQVRRPLAHDDPLTREARIVQGSRDRPRAGGQQAPVQEEERAQTGAIVEGVTDEGGNLSVGGVGA